MTNERDFVLWLEGYMDGHKAKTLQQEELEEVCAKLKATIAKMTGSPATTNTVTLRNHHPGLSINPLFTTPIGPVTCTNTNNRDCKG